MIVLVKNSKNICIKAKPFPMFHDEETLRVTAYAMFHDEETLRVTAYATKDSSLIQGSIARLRAKSIPS